MSKRREPRLPLLLLLGALGPIALLGCDEPKDAPDDGSVLAVDARSSPADGEGTARDADTAALDAGDPDEGIPCEGGSLSVDESALHVLHHDGQSFVWWPDRAEGEEGAAYRYRVFRSATPIRDDADLASAERVAEVYSHSGQLLGTAFRPADRLDATKPMALLETGGEPLPPWSGLAVSTARASGCAYFAVIATDLEGAPVESVEPGRNATSTAIAERRAPLTPILLEASEDRPGPYVPQTRITGTPNLPLVVNLHASSATGGTAGDYGDSFTYFGDRSMGYQDGMPGIFTVREDRYPEGNRLLLANRDTIVAPSGASGLETHWFGYVTETDTLERHAYPFTEARLLFTIQFAIERYQVDPERVFAVGQSMGAWGTMTFAYRRPEIFAAVYPSLARFRQRTMAAVLVRGAEDTDTLPSGEPWREHHDSIRFVEANRARTLPFLAWNVGRQDGYATWQEEVDMVNALTAARQGFAFAWNNGNHSEGTAPADLVRADYPLTRFARNLSFPAFTESSIDDDPGTGDPTEGDLVGGINLGFEWTDPVESASGWSTEIGNHRCTVPMTVTITPRRTQRFHPSPGARVRYTSSRGESGELTVDEDGLVSAPISIAPGAATTLSFELR